MDSPKRVYLYLCTPKAKGKSCGDFFIPSRVYTEGTSDQKMRNLDIPCPNDACGGYGIFVEVYQREV